MTGYEHKITMFAERERMLRQFKPFWQESFEKRKRENGKSGRGFIDEIINEFE